jgi:hypothetical protein
VTVSDCDAVINCSSANPQQPSRGKILGFPEFNKIFFLDYPKHFWHKNSAEWAQDMFIDVF